MFFLFSHLPAFVYARAPGRFGHQVTFKLGSVLALEAAVPAAPIAIVRSALFSSAAELQSTPDR